MVARGIRNNNPGNIRHGVDWLGDEPEGVRADKDFETFLTMAHGIRAMLVLLKTYRRKYGADTVREVISRWAPSSENNTKAYIDAVCAGWVTPDEVLPDTRDTYLFLAQRIVAHENGKDWKLITEDDWRTGLLLAGFNLDNLQLQPTPNPLPEESKEEGIMAVPTFIWAAATELLPFVADLFRGHGSKTAVRNADIIEKVGQPLVDIAKTVTKTTTSEDAVAQISADPALQREFRQAVQDDLDRLIGMIERLTTIEDDSRDRAAARAKVDGFDILQPLLDRGFQLLAAVCISLLGLLVIGFLAGVQNEPLMILLTTFVATCTKLVDRWGQLYDYRVGSSAGSHMKDSVIAAGRK